MRASRRRTAVDPHPDLMEAVTVTRFWSLVEALDGDMCWPWQGDRDTGGYGVFMYHGKKHGAHQLALSFATGEKRGTLDTCHSCDNPSCCNPAHLRFDTRAANIADMDARGRRVNTGKLTAEQVREMRERRANGARQIDLARDYGVTDGLVSQIVRGKKWASAGGPIETERRYIRGE